MPKITFKTIGCRLNQAETQDLQADFITAGWDLVAPAQSADVFVINSCAVTHAAVRKSRQALRAWARRWPRGRVVVMGCGAEFLKDLAAVDLVISNKDKNRARAIICTNKNFSQLSGKKTRPARLRTRALVKIQTGCAEKCTYCLVPYLRGRPRSLPASAVLAKVRKLAAAGIREIVLTGVHIGLYRSGGVNLPELINKILQATENLRVRLSSIEPQYFTAGILKTFRNPRVCPFIHLPIQSGATPVLRKMGRRYQPVEIKKLVGKIRRTVPEVFLSTDVIVGFPGSTETDFKNTYKFCRELNFAKIHVFSYSKREGTRAADFKGHLEPAVIKNRSERLRCLSDRLNFSFRRKLIGSLQPVLFETETSGISSNGVKVLISKEKAEINSLSLVKITKVSNKHTEGKTVS
jgi:threonylcarbamoyladenosine tRNA methylthiotransferase MtaB